MTSECLTDGLGANMCTFTGYLPLITAVARLLFLLELLYWVSPRVRETQPEGPVAKLSVTFYLKTEENPGSEMW
jgi:hypothetical protein